jgi:excinuclease ABC subunit A
MTPRSPRSTVGTTTEIYDFLRLLYARAGVAYSYATGSKMVKYTDEQILELLQRDFAGRRILLLAPVVKGRKGHYRELFENLRKNGFISVRVDGELREMKIGMSVDRYKMHDIEIVVDKIVMDQIDLKRLKNSVATAMKHGKGVMMVKDYASDEIKYYSRHLMCPDTGLSYKDPAPHTFSFNSPHGACKKCKGLGYVNEVAMEKIIPDNSLSIYAGGILPLGKYKASLIFYQIETILRKHGADIKQPIRDLPEEALTDVLYGYPGQFRLENAEIGVSSNFLTTYEGILKYVTMQEENSTSKKANKWAEQFISVSTCDACNGQRLNQEALHFYINGKNISELANMELSDLYEWISNVEEHLEDKQKQIAGEILKEIRTRLKFTLDVGLEYLSLNRQSMTLSGGESQRIRLATQIGSQLVNVLYILDEPSIGLHQKDNRKLIHSLQELRDNGNSVIVVEHDKEMMENADYIVDLGPKAGRKGGEIMAIGKYSDILKSDSLTAQYLTGKKMIAIPAERRVGNGKKISLKGCTGNNLKNVDVDFPLGKLICVTGVSGSGKSSLINGTLHPI